MKFLLQFLGINASLGTYIILLHDNWITSWHLPPFSEKDIIELEWITGILSIFTLTIWSKLRHINISTISQSYSIQVCWSAKLEKSRLTMLFFNASIEIPCVTPLFIQLFKHSPLLTHPNWHLSHDLCGVRLGFGRYVYGKNIYSHFRLAQISALHGATN